MPAFYTSLTQTDAQQNLRHFLNVLNRKVYGNRVRHGHKLNCIPVIEGGQQTRRHYHLCLEQAPNMTFEEFAILVVETWRSTTWGYRQVDIQPCDGGWVGYMAKLKTKSSYGDSIDWTNFFIRANAAA